VGEEAGAENWSYAHCLPYFKKSETRLKGGDAYRGDQGPLFVTTGSSKNPLYQAFIEAGRQAGYPVTEDMNGYQQEGLGWMDMTTYKGRRWSAARAHLRPAERRGRVEVKTRALVTRVVFEGRRAVGVEYLKAGRVATARARREVILERRRDQLAASAHAVGDRRRRRAQGARHRRHPAPCRASVENLQDQHRGLRPICLQAAITLYGATNPLAKLKIGVEWILTGKGLAAPTISNRAASSAASRRSPSRPAVPLPADGGEL